VYGGGTPQAFDVQPTSFPSNIDITLEDPNAASPRPVMLPMRTEISRIYPNPFNSQATISFTLATSGQLELALYDLLGRRTEVIAQGACIAGEHQQILNAGDLPSGLYFVSLRSGTISSVQRLLLMK
jgi:hypothetical protein